ncbi:unnamed protein product, partial [Pylaiella littoralis]
PDRGKAENKRGTERRGSDLLEPRTRPVVFKRHSSRTEEKPDTMADVFSSTSPCMLGKRVLSPHSHSSSSSTFIGGQLDFSSKKRRLGQDADQGTSDHHHHQGQRSPSPMRTGKRARPLSPLQPSSHFLGDSSSRTSSAAFSGSFGFSQQQQRVQKAAEAVQDSELADLRREVGALHAQAAEKDGGLNMAREENARLKEGLGMYQKELERLASENRILKRAVGIQNTKGKELEGQLHGLQQAGGQAAEYIKRLEQTNYALSVRVQAMGNSGPSDFVGGQRPPDVF